MISAIVLLAAAAIGSDSLCSKEVADLTDVHRIAIVDAPSYRLIELRNRLVAEIPGVQLATEEEADLVIKYREEPASEVPALHQVEWAADLSRLDCQNAEFGAAPGKPSEGPCQRRVFVRTDLGWMAGLTCGDESAVAAFSAALKQAILAPASEALLPCLTSPHFGPSPDTVP